MGNKELIDRLISKMDANQVAKQSFIADLKIKLEREDYHGVVDAAMDLRDLETEIEALQKVVKILQPQS